MKKFFARFILALLAAVMILGVVGCGSSNLEEVAGKYEMMSASGTVNGTKVTKDSFDYFRLNLEVEGNATLQYKTSGSAGSEFESVGTYTYKEGMIRMVIKNGDTKVAEEYKYDNGVIYYSIEKGQSNNDLGPTKYTIRLRKVDDAFMREIVGTYEMTSINGKILGVQIQMADFKYYRLILDEDGNAFEQINLSGIGNLSDSDSTATYVYENGKIKVSSELGSVSGTDIYDYDDGVLTLIVKKDRLNFTVVLEKVSNNTSLIPDNPDDDTPENPELIKQFLVGTYELTLFSGKIHGVQLTTNSFKYCRITIDSEGNFKERVRLKDDYEFQFVDSAGTITYENGKITVYMPGEDEDQYYITEYYYSLGVITYSWDSEDSSYIMVFEKIEE